MFWLTFAVLAIATLLVTALAVPVHVDIKIRLAEGLHNEARLRWLFGLVDVSLGADRARSPTPATPDAVTPTAWRVHKGRALTVGRRIKAVLRTRGLLPRIVRFFEDMRRHTHVRDLIARVRYGFEDPADTGQMCGALAPALVFASVQGVDVLCMPDFGRAVFDGGCSTRISVRPLSVVIVVLVFACSPPVWRGIRAWRQTS